MKAKKKKAPDLIPEPSFQFRPKKSRPHVAHEYRERQHPDIGEELTRNLMPWAQQNALGLSVKPQTEKQHPMPMKRGITIPGRP